MRYFDQLNLLKQLVRREISATVKDSTLGFLWLLFAPLLSLGIYFVVFGILFGGSFSKTNPETSFQYAIGVYIGLSTVMFINESISKSPILIKSNSVLVKKVVFPLPILPVVQTAGIGFKFFVNFILWFVMGSIFAHAFSISSLYLILILLPVPIFALALTYIISSIGAFLPDIQHLTPSITQIIFWSSGVFYSSEKLLQVPALYNIIKWNPFFAINENTRSLVISGQLPDLADIAITYGSSIALLTFGLALFMRIQHSFSDSI